MGQGKDSAPNIAIFCDYENVAIGAQQARYEAFDIGLVTERLLAKGNIVVKKAYADWDRYKPAKRALHEAAFELIEVPHVSYSGKNSADIRLVVDALDLCYTKGHIDLFVIISGDSDFSPLVAKLRENAKTVIGIGVKNSSSDLLIDNCDEFILYDDLVRSKARPGRTMSGRGKPPMPMNRPRIDKPRVDERGGLPAKDLPQREATRESVLSPVLPGSPAKEQVPSTNALEPRPAELTRAPLRDAAERPSESALKVADAAAPAKPTAEDTERRKLDALEMVLEVVDALFRERDDNLWGSQVKQTLKRKKPQFDETFHGYRNFTDLLADAERRGLLELQKDEKSGGYLVVAFGPDA